MMAAPAGEGVKTLAEATLAVVLFAGASRIKPCVLRREYAVPLRLLGVGLPLTIAIGAVLAAVIFDQLNLTEAVRVGDTAGAHGRGTRRGGRDRAATPVTIRQGLNVESGLNDVYVPLLIALAAADVEDKAASGSHAIRIVAEQIGYGILGGAAAGLAAAVVVVALAYRRDLISGSWLQVIPVAGAGLAYGIAVALGGSGFIAAFLAEAIFGALVSHESEQASRLSEELGALLGGVTFLIFGAVLLDPALEHVSWQIAIYVGFSLTLVRMLPVAVAVIAERPNRRLSEAHRPASLGRLADSPIRGPHARPCSDVRSVESSRPDDVADCRAREVRS
jgi:NhaP-type Na+/H+ or K+/H+ antiporter